MCQGMSTSEGQRRSDGLERKYVRQDWGGLDMYWVHWEKDADDGAARKEETGKA